jgi:nucleotide-binding universal stress UspA family protein
MFTHLLVPIDLSRRNEPALGTAVALAVQNHARVTLIHVIHRIQDVPTTELRGFYDRLERKAQQALARAARRFTRKRVAIRTVALIGDPAREIVRWAAANGVDLIVMSSHPVDPSRTGYGWGTTSYKVGLLCRCPVLLVK